MGPQYDCDTTTIRVWAGVDRAGTADARRVPVPARKSDPSAVTAIPAESDPNTLLLICDSCGRAFTPDRVLRTWPDLWREASTDGWTGRDRRVGPHSCDLCGIGVPAHRTG